MRSDQKIRLIMPSLFDSDRRSRSCRQPNRVGRGCGSHDQKPGGRRHGDARARRRPEAQPMVRARTKADPWACGTAARNRFIAPHSSASRWPNVIQRSSWTGRTSLTSAKRRERRSLAARGLQPIARYPITLICEDGSPMAARLGVQSRAPDPPGVSAGSREGSRHFGAAGVVTVAARRPTGATTPCRSCRLSENHNLGGHGFGRECCPIEVRMRDRFTLLTCNS